MIDSDSPKEISYLQLTLILDGPQTNRKSEYIFTSKSSDLIRVSRVTSYFSLKTQDARTLIVPVWPSCRGSADLSKPRLRARSLQSHPRALGASRLAQIFWRMEAGRRKAYGPTWEEGRQAPPEGSGECGGRVWTVREGGGGNYSEHLCFFSITVSFVSTSAWAVESPPLPPGCLCVAGISVPPLPPVVRRSYRWAATLPGFLSPGWRCSAGVSGCRSRCDRMGSPITKKGSIHCSGIQSGFRLQPVLLQPRQCSREIGCLPQTTFSQEIATPEEQSQVFLWP